MEKQKFFEKIQNALKEYYLTTPCRNRTCDGKEWCCICECFNQDQQLYKTVEILKNEYEERFGTSYDADLRELMVKNYREASKKENIANFLNKYAVEDILKVAVELGKTDKMVSVDMACEWLEDKLRMYAGYSDTADLVDSFRKAMED